MEPPAGPATLVGFAPHPDARGGFRFVVGGAHAPDRCLRNEKISEAPYAIRALLTEGKLKGKFSRTVQNLLANLRGLPEDRGRSTDRAMKTIDDAVQDAFIACHGLQCGFCTPGMVMSAVDLVQHHGCHNEQQVREALEGNICRCTGYHNIVKAVLSANEAMTAGRQAAE